jgi:hypothetical protein
MGRKWVAWVLVVLGGALVALSVSADAVGLGPGDYIFGWEQKLGVAVGTALAWMTCLWLVGRVPSVARRRPATPREAERAPAVTAAST